MVEVSLILPAYNEADKLRETVLQVAGTLNEISSSFEIIVAEDGSKDGTDKIAEELAEKYSYIKHLHSKERLGRGKALNQAFKSAKGEVLAYIDVDLATDLNHLEELINAIRNGFDFSTGSRMLKESDVERSFTRLFASKGFNFFTRLLLRSKLKDHQCGFKAFRREALFDILDDIEDNHWFWDTELLVRAQRKGYKVYEFPVRWRHTGTTKVDLTKDVVDMGSKLIKLWLETSSTPIYLAFLVSFIILILIFIYSGMQDVLDVLSGLSLSFLLLACMIYLIPWLFRGLRYDTVVNKIMSRKCGTGFMTGTVAISQTANLITPARIGDIIRAFILKKKRGVPYSTGASSLVAERVFDVISIIFLSAASLFFLLSLRLPKWASNVIITVGLLLIVFFIFLLLVRKTRFRLLNKIINEVKLVSLSPRTFGSLTLLSLIIWLLDIATCYVVITSFGLSVNIMLVTFAVMVGNLAKIVPLTPGGIGTYEAAVTAILALSLSPAEAFSVALLDHLIKNIITLALGLVFLSVLGLRLSEIKASRSTVLGRSGRNE